MDFLKKNMVAIGAGVVLLGAIYVYMTYFSPPPAATLTTSDANATISQNLLVTLQNLHTIKLDNSIFSEPAFQSLTDFGVVIPQQNVGRRDPFLPVAGTATVGAGGITLPKTQ
ncbi:MAG TPA: hypothetical protein VN665_00010 [Candidatus Paceibacterota bacterium]|nr:hypothetical protein [Candidatus Paceibacterota bacterium]